MKDVMCSSSIHKNNEVEESLIILKSQKKVIKE